MKNKLAPILTIVILILLITLFSLGFVNCIKYYEEFDVEYEELLHDEFTFKKYEKINRGKSGQIYEIYFEEYSKPFEVSNITQIHLNKNGLNKLMAGEIVEVYYLQNHSGNYTYEILEMSTGSTILLSLDDYITVNQNNQIVGMIICPILGIIALFLFVIYIRHLISRNDEYKKTRNFTSNSKLGQVRIEYKINGNTIRIYNSYDTCSLIINGKIVDQYFGVVATRFTLKGHLFYEGEKIPVEARMGFLNMRLYYNGLVVAKKFMGLG